jgi:hypothetical protein
MKNLFILFMAIFLQLFAAIALYANSYSIGIITAVLGTTLLLLIVSKNILSRVNQVYFSLTSLLFLIIIVLDILNMVTINYLIIAALFGLVLVSSPFAIKKKMLKTKIVKLIPKPKKVISLKTGKIYHKLDCPLVQKTKKQNIKIFDSSNDAKSKNLKACKMCLPQ